MKKQAVKKVKRSTKTIRKKNASYLPIFLFILGVLAIITTVYIVTTHWTETRSRAATSGWLSGVSCVASETNKGFESWRGSPVTIAGTWNDNSLDSQTNQWSMSGEYGDWSQSVDVSIGGIMEGTWADAANGSYDANWHAALAAIDKSWGSKKTVFIRFAHEFNGNWYKKWLVNSGNNEDYKKAFARFYQIVQTDLVAKGRDAKVVWPPNSDDHNGIKATDSWPGDQYVDVVGVDYYDWDRATDQSKWDAAFNKAGTYGGPAGVGAWQAFAKEHGKPISFPEWGTDGYGPTEDPFFIQKMNEFFRTNAGTGPGQVWYEIYFDCTGYTNNGKGEVFLIYPEGDSNVPQTAAMYKSLKWGDGGVVTNPSTVVPSNILLTPSFVCGGSQNCVPSVTEPPTNNDNNEQPIPSTNVTNPSQTPGDNNNDGNNDGNNDQDNNNNNGRHHERSGGGFFALLLQLFQLIIELLKKLFGN